MVPSAVNFLYCTNSSYSEIFQVDMHFHLLPEMPYLAVNNTNCFLSARVMSLA